MKMLTATAAGQGIRRNDFDFAIEGELVWIGFVCDTDLNDPDGGCGCGRAFAGLNSHRATTTAQVRDLPLSRSDVICALDAYYRAAGYGSFDHDDLGHEVDDVTELVSHWPEGAIVERRLDEFQVRQTTP